jgi:HEAT repeats
MNKCKWAVALMALWAACAAPADAAWVRVGIGIGLPIYPAPWYGPYGYPYYQPYPVYVSPPPVYVAPAPAVVQPAPTVYQPVPAVQSRSQNYEELPPPRANTTANQPDISRFLQQMSSGEERVRADAALELGRMKAQQALDPLCSLLNSDNSPQVRETAARALGLLGNSRALPVLQNAALADNDREVRHSAQFSAEVIRATLRKQ